MEGKKQVVSVEEAATQVGLDLERNFPVHCLDPTLNVVEVKLGKELHWYGIYTRNSDGARFTLCDVAYFFELDEILWVSEDDAQMVGVWCDEGVRIVKCGYTITRLVFPFALDTLRSPIVVTLLLEIWRSKQIEDYD